VKVTVWPMKAGFSDDTNVTLGVALLTICGFPVRATPVFALKFVSPG
jgi:hypothetical protein